MSKSSTLQNSLILAPLIGASDSLVKAIGLLLAGLAIICTYGLCMRGLRPLVTANMRLIASILLSACVVSCVELAVQAWAFELHRQLGIYLGLMALQCVLLEYTSFFEAPVPLRPIGLLCLLPIILGALREVLGNGSLGNHLPWLAGMTDTDGQGWTLIAQGGLHLFGLAPGGFILLGLLIAARQAWAASRKSH